MKEDRVTRVLRAVKVIRVCEGSDMYLGFRALSSTLTLVWYGMVSKASMPKGMGHKQEVLLSRQADAQKTEVHNPNPQP